jgi:pimeloyl-ACP methyl ester carboxylesterase
MVLVLVFDIIFDIAVLSARPPRCRLSTADSYTVSPMRIAPCAKALVVLLLLAAGCSKRDGTAAAGAGEDPPAPTAPDDAAGTSAAAEDGGMGRVDDRPIEPPSPLPGAEINVPEAVEFPSTEGVIVHASLWRTGDPEAPAVIFVHQARSDRSEWDPFIQALRARTPGITVLAPDLRGHGASTKAGDAAIRYQDLQSGDHLGLRRWASCTSDVQASLNFLRSRGEGTIPRAIGLVGSSIGSTAVLRAAANDGVAGPGRIAAVVAISPGLDYFSVPTRGAIETLKVRKLPVLVVGARDDTNDVVGAAQEMQTILADNMQVAIYENGGHGVAIAAAHPDLIGVVIDFLKPRLGL